MNKAVLVQALKLVYYGEADLNNCLHAESLPSGSPKHFIQVWAQFLENNVKVSRVTLTVRNELV